MRKQIQRFLLLVSTIFILFFPTTAKAYTFYQELTTEPVMPGVQYEKRRRVTDKGLLDIHLLRVSLDAPYVRVGTAYGNELAKKEQTSAIVTMNDAIAGVNGDFFGMKSRHSGPLGVSVSDGVPSVSETSGLDYMSSTFYMTHSNDAFMDYFSITLSFMLDGEHVLPIGAVNKAFDITYPIVLTGEMASTTQDVDNRFRSQKIVVSNGIITSITQGCETVSIPPDGFVLIIKEDHDFLQRVQVGQKAHVYIESSIALQEIETAISGSNKILSNGQLTEGKDISGRHPRTALGINQAKDELIMVVVDGRSLSVGATHEEMGHIMQALGAYDAMHLDGGGSSTMVVKKEGNDSPHTVNRVSDSTERMVANALAVYNDAPTEAPTRLIVTPSSQTVVHGQAVSLEAYGLDDYSNKTPVSLESCVIDVSGGWYENGKIHASEAGIVNVTVSYGALSTTFTIESLDICEIRANVSTLSGIVGSSTPLSFEGLSQSGLSAPVDSSLISYEVVPSHLGAVENHTYMSHTMGSGYLMCVYNGKTIRNIPINNVFIEKPFGSLDENTVHTTTTYPDEILAETTFSAEQTVDGNGSLRLTYTFLQSSETQAAYINFPQIILPSDAKTLSTYVKGNGASHWLKGRIIDADGKTFTIDFSKSITSEFTKVVATLPDEAQRPLQLTQLYVASLSESVGDAYEVYIDTLGISVTEDNSMTVPLSSTFKDPWRRNHMEIAAMNDSLAITTEKAEVQQKAGILYYPIDSKNKSIMHTNASHWETINQAIKGDYPYLVFHLDQLPSEFNLAEEFALLHNLLLEGQANGKKIIVLGNGKTNEVVMQDGIHYIRMASTIKLSAGEHAVYYTFE